MLEFGWLQPIPVLPPPPLPHYAEMLSSIGYCRLTLYLLKVGIINSLAHQTF